MDSDEEDCVFYGTPIEREEEFTSRKKKAVAEASGNLRSLPVWKQEVTDEEGRRRFHGAFQGGFSAGYYNTVGSKEGWAPQSFVSSRKNRAEVKQQNILNFLDEDEKAELEGQSLQTSLQFDTFGFTAAELARKKAEKEQQQRPSAIPGPVPDEIVLPATESIGVKLLLRMGWRHGHSIKDAHVDSLYDARREARKAFLAFSSDDGKAQLVDSKPVQGDLETFTEWPANDDVQSRRSTPVYVLNPKQDLHGLGFDPYKHAPEFREKKRSRTSGKGESGNRKAYSLKDNLFGFKSGNVAPGFGIGALEELDAEDEDVYAPDSAGFDFEETYVQEVEQPSRLETDSKRKLVAKEQGVLPGFRVSSNSDYQLERFNAPVVPRDFVPHHKFPGPLETNYKLADDPPPEVPPPDDNNLKLLIDGVAALVARCGKLFEDLLREKNQSNPLFGFLTGGNGHDYYARKLWEEQQKRDSQRKQQVDGKLSSSIQKMTAENRGKILGEKPLERSTKDSSSSAASAEVIQLQYNLSDTFTEPASFGASPEVVKPFKDDPAKQERFEQFLKDKYQGGLRTTESSGASNMSEAARARERLDFEAAAEAIKKGQWGKESKPSSKHFMEFPLTGGMQFTSGSLEQAKDSLAEDVMTKKMFPQREEYQWRPSPVLCKRFDLTDPYMGKPPPAPRMRSKIDSLFFTSESGKAAKVEEAIAANRDSFPTPRAGAQDISEDIANKQIEAEVEVENVERPVDLYKAIFSDDSDNEGETANLTKVEDPEKKVEAVNTTLNRLIAGDFLESLGKELGLEVPPEPPSSTNNARVPASQKETASAGAGDTGIFPVKNKLSPAVISGTSVNHEVPHRVEIAQDGQSKKVELIYDNSDRNVGIYGKKVDEEDPEKVSQDDKKAKTCLSHHRNQNGSSSSEDERSRKRSRKHRLRSDSDSDSSSGHRDRYHSRSKGRKKGSSREKSSSHRKHSKHHKRRSRDSPARY